MEDEQYGTAEETKDEVVARLAKLSPIEYGRVKFIEAETLGCNVGEQTAEVKRARSSIGAQQGRPLELPEPEAWGEPVDGDAVLDQLRQALLRYLVLPAHAAVAIALWVLHTYAMGAAHHTARLLFQSPEMRCGKSTALNVLRRLVLRPLQAANVSTAAVFRTVEAARPTLLVDEADTFLARSDELRGVINSGHEKHGAVIRVDGDQNEPRVFATFAATAIACIGKMPGTIEDRAIIIHMKRKKRDEVVDRLRGDRAPELDELASMAARWVGDNLVALQAKDVDPPLLLSDRAADGWRPLLAIADLAGGEWPDLARQAAISLSASSEDEESIRVMLLKDIRSIFDNRKEGAISSELVVADLLEMEDRPWAEYGRARKPITKGRLATLLRPFVIAPNNIRIGASVRKGYRLEQFTDAFERYLPADPPNQNATRYNTQKTAENGQFQNATPDPDVAFWNAPKPAENLACSGVAPRNGLGGGSHTYQPDDEDLEADRQERIAIQSV